MYEKEVKLTEKDSDFLDRVLESYCRLLNLASITINEDDWKSLENLKRLSNCIYYQDRKDNPITLEKFKEYYYILKID